MLGAKHISLAQLGALHGQIACVIHTNNKLKPNMSHVLYVSYDAGLHCRASNVISVMRDCHPFTPAAVLKCTNITVLDAMSVKLQCSRGPAGQRQQQVLLPHCCLMAENKERPRRRTVEAMGLVKGLTR